MVPPEVDFDRLLASLKDLSELVVEGETQVTPVPGGARLHVLEPIPLKLYRNGIIMFDGPFRPFYDPSTQVSAGDRLLPPARRQLEMVGLSSPQAQPTLHRAPKPSCSWCYMHDLQRAPTQILGL